ncbi:MAG: hypothetical protein IIB05_00155 [Bacteroidetes bacterium]|nr:hypothetical protein [Bacteroidota bacterium]
MRSFSLNIADYITRFVSAEPETELFTTKRYNNFFSDNRNVDITIRVHSGILTPEKKAVRVFHAPYIKETDNIKIKINDEFWTVYKNNDDILIETILPLGKKNRKACMRINTGADVWDLYISGVEKKRDPLEYPLDGLLLYYLTVRSGDIFIHGSGVNINNRGYLFAGVSGKGKTTIARLWNEAGARVIHDDRLIIRNINNRFVMYNTPVYNNETPRSAPVDKIFLIDHGTVNTIVPTGNSEALSLLMANCIQHLWDPSIIESLTAALVKLTSETDVRRLFFRPDKSVISYILKNEK